MTEPEKTLVITEEGASAIPNTSLRRYTEQISSLLTEMFTLSITTSDISSDWRIERVTLIHKIGDRRNGDRGFL